MRRKLLLLLLLLFSLSSSVLLSWQAIFGRKPPARDADAGLSRQERAIKAIEALGGKVEKGWASLDEKPSVSVRLAGLKRLAMADLEPLKDILFIKELDLSQTRIGDRELKVLTGMESLDKLRKLDLAGTRVTDVGVRELKHLMHLCWLDLAGTGVTGAGVRELGELSTLFALRLADTAISDEELKELKELQTLRSLDLSRTAVTDAGLKHLRALTGLRELWLEKTRISDAAAAELQEGLPATKIQR
jgi:hypothetical protein